MTEEQIFAGNKLIVEFMGGSVNKTYESATMIDYSVSGDIVSHWRSLGLKTGGFENKMMFSNCLFHSKIEWLMEAIIKIWKIGFTVAMNFQSVSQQYECSIFNATMSEQIIEEDENPIEVTWTTVVEFIKWYNQHGWHNQNNKK